MNDKVNMLRLAVHFLKSHGEPRDLIHDLKDMKVSLREVLEIMTHGRVMGLHSLTSKEIEEVYHPPQQLWT